VSITNILKEKKENESLLHENNTSVEIRRHSLGFMQNIILKVKRRGGGVPLNNMNFAGSVCHVTSS